MNFIFRFLYLSVFALPMLISCAETQDEPFDKKEKQALEAWITQNRSDLVGNYQAKGGYYVEILNAGDLSQEPLNTDPLWVRFDFSGRDLSGNIILTRNASEARLVGTFTKYTHYVPFYRYCGEANTQLMEGTFLAMRNTLTLGDEYYEANRDKLGLTAPELELRIGSRIRLYMPSSVVGTVEGSGGYEGQFTLNLQRPFIVTMEIRDTVSNPLQREGKDVDMFAERNGGLQIYGSEADESDGVILRPEDSEDPNHAFNIAERWVSACDTIPQLYVNVRYNPADDILNFDNPYYVGYEPYVDAGSVRSIDERIAAALKERFHGADSDVGEYVGVKNLDADSVTLDGPAKIWYIGRFLDGFIFETNIDEVQEIIYGEVKSKGTALSYPPSDGSVIQAFNYVIPNLKFGQWAALITTSTNAYGSSGASGSSTTSSSGYSNYYDYMNYLNYSNSYYGSSYYGGYYNNYYNNYYNGYYNNYGYGDTSSSTTTTTTTTIQTEIASYTPLIFQIYIEPAAE